MTPSRLRRFAQLLAVSALALLCGCFNPFKPRVLGIGISTPPPVPGSPGGVLRLFEWAYTNRAISEYREIFTDDYRFVFSQLDPAGNAYRTEPFTREDELASATRLFQGSSEQAPAVSIQLNLDRNFQVRSDRFYPESGRWRKSIRTSVQLSILDASQVRTDVTGFATFFLVRGDSAVIPDELRQKGFGPDSTRWYIRRWEDETVQFGSPAPARLGRSGGATPAPLAITDTWGGLKLRWLPPPAAPRRRELPPAAFLSED